MTDLFADPNFLSLLAGLGARLDPQGVGGAIGGAVTQGIQSQAAQKSLAGQEKSRMGTSALLLSRLLPEGEQQTQMVQRAIDLLGLTPKGTKGVTGLEMGKDGGITLKIDPATTPLNQQGPVSQEPTITSAPSTGIVSSTRRPQRSSQLNALIPFY